MRVSRAEIAQNAGGDAEQSAHADLQRRMPDQLLELFLIGERLLELCEQIASRKGEGVSHGVEMTIAPDGKLLTVRLNGEEIRDDRTYRIATLDYLAQGNDGLLAFQDGTDLVSPQDAANNVRFIIMDYFRAAKAKGKAVDSKVEGRIIVQP